eukprot:gene52436-biopygen113424
MMTIKSKLVWRGLPAQRTQPAWMGWRPAGLRHAHSVLNRQGMRTRCAGGSREISGSGSARLDTPCVRVRAALRRGGRQSEGGSALAAVSDHDGLRRLPALRPDALDRLHDVHTLHDSVVGRSRATLSTTLPKTTCFPSSHGVATVQRKNCDPFVPATPPLYPWGSRPRAGVRHRQDAGARVLQDEVLVLEFIAVDGLPAGTQWKSWQGLYMKCLL